MIPGVVEKSNFNCTSDLWILHQPYPNQPCNKIRAHVRSARNPRALPWKLKIAPTTLPTIAGHACNNSSHNSRKCLNSLTSKSFEGIFNHFFKDSLSFAGDDPEKMVIERAVIIDTDVIPCSRNKVQIRSVKDLSLSRAFSVVSLILCNLCLFDFMTVF